MLVGMLKDLQPLLLVLLLHLHLPCEQTKMAVSTLEAECTEEDVWDSAADPELSRRRCLAFEGVDVFCCDEEAEV